MCVFPLHAWYITKLAALNDHAAIGCFVSLRDGSKPSWGIKTVLVFWLVVRPAHKHTHTHTTAGFTTPCILCFWLCFWQV